MKYPLPATAPAPRRARSTPALRAFATLCGVVAALTFGAHGARADAPQHANSAGVASATGAHPPLVLRRAHGGARFTLTPATGAGGFDAADLEMARRAFAWREDDFRSEHPVSTRLLDLVYRTMRHFDANEIELISGFRDGRTTSRHSHGRAIDFIVPGVQQAELAAYLRTLGFVGVGIYPRTGFVHLDVRSESYFWVDRARSGRRGRVRPILGNLAAQADAEARARGEAPDQEVATAEREEKEAFERGDLAARVGRARAARVLARRQRVIAERQRLRRRALRAERSASEG
jgi:uncharacterized protein YcbK (DUF882 family)